MLRDGIFEDYAHSDVAEFDLSNMSNSLSHHLDRDFEYLVNTNLHSMIIICQSQFLTHMNPHVMALLCYVSQPIADTYMLQLELQLRIVAEQVINNDRLSHSMLESYRNILLRLQTLLSSDFGSSAVEFDATFYESLNPSYQLVQLPLICKSTINRIRSDFCDGIRDQNIVAVKWFERLYLQLNVKWNDN